MGASSREIEQQMKQTRERMDENLGVLETRAANGWQRYGRIAAIVAGLALSAGVGLIVWRKMRRPTLKDRLDRLSPEALRRLADEVSARLKKPLPTVSVTVSEKDGEPGMLENVLRNVTPALVGTAATGLVERLARPRGATAQAG
jgi:hypothetical protein